MKCLAVPKTTIKQCRNIACNDTKFCQLHGKFKEKEKTIQLYNGSVYTFTDTFTDIISFTKPIFLWQEFNRELVKSNKKGISKSYKRKIDEQAKLIKFGSQNKIIDFFISDGNFKSIEDVLNFNWIPTDKKCINGQIKIKKFNKKTLDSARHFLGVIFYFNRKIEKLKKIQVNIRIKLKYGKCINTIIKLQKWIRYKTWLKKLPITPLRLRKQFIPNINKIILLQRVFKKYINIKVKRSHNCPFSLEDYCDIPNKYRVVYKYKAGGNYHWRYFLSQTSEKRFVIEATTKEEFPNEFVEEIARKSWHLTRIENDYLSIFEDNTNNNMNIPRYIIEDDWIHRFKRRSLYRFSLMFLDLFVAVGLTTDKINIWRNAEFKLKYQIFYLKVMPELKNIASNIYLSHIEEDIFYITQDMFRMEYILPDSINYEEIAADAIYGILRLIMSSQRCHSDIYNIIKDVIKENIQTLLMN